MEPIQKRVSVRPTILEAMYLKALLCYQTYQTAWCICSGTTNVGYTWGIPRFFELLLFLEIAVGVQGKLVFLYDRTKFLVFNHFSKMLMAN